MINNFKIAKDNILGDVYFPIEDGVISSKIDRDGVYDKPEIDWILNNIKNDSNCLNVGANVGYFSALMAKYAPNGNVTSIEANPNLIPFLKKNLENLKNIEIFNFAAGDKKGICELFINNVNFGDNRILDPRLLKNSDEYYNYPMENEGFESEIESVVVEMKALDDVIVNKIDLVLIDTQGADHLVIKGLEKNILKYKPKILVEYVPKWQDAITGKDFDVIKYYKTLGYKVLPVGLNYKEDVDSDKELYPILKNEGRFFTNLELIPIK